jgi:hypothetical protein
MLRRLTAANLNSRMLRRLTAANLNSRMLRRLTAANLNSRMLGGRPRGRDWDCVAGLKVRPRMRFAG